MDNLLTHLASLFAEPFDCIVHVGAGADAASADYSALRAKSLFLIEADPESHAALAERLKEAPHATVINALVVPQAGDTTFHRFDLPSLNAPLGLGRLPELYPRINLIEDLRINGQALHQVVSEELLGERNLLIFDIPGQEAALLRALPLEFLERFSSVVVFAASEPWQEGAEPLEATLATLKQRNYQLARETSDDPAWPAIVVQRDESKAKLQEELDRSALLFASKTATIKQQSEQIARLEKQVTSMAVASREAEAGKVRMARKLSALESSIKKAAKKRSIVAKERQKAGLARRKQIETLETSATRLSSEYATLQSERNALVDRLASLVTASEELQGQHLSLTAERDSLAARFTSLESDHASLITLHSSLVAERDDLVTRHTSHVTEREALQSAHSSLSTLHSSLIAERDELSTTHSALIAERNEIVSAFEELQAQHSSLSTLHSTLVAERDDLVTAMEELQGQHSSLVTEREALQSDLSAKSTLLDVLTKGRIAQDEQMEKLLQREKGLLSEREGFASRAAELSSQVAKLEAHTKLIDEEFGKAEGQIDLIKDIFLREAIR